MSFVKNLKVARGKFQLNIDSWEIADSGITALVGPSGAGKTTVFEALIGFLPVPRFSWKMGNEDLAELNIGERRLGVVFQTWELFPHLTGFENLAFAARARKIPDPDWKAHARHLWERLELNSVAGQKASLLSGGEKQRMALARALIGRPRMLLLDEPFSSLDPELRAAARQLVEEVIHEEKVPCLLITHDPEDVRNLADHVVKMNQGQIETR